jgi:aminoglycoside phosphotransferase family enzyme/predicted kinase
MDPPAAIVETHISVLVFVGDRAMKLKKPVRFPFLDFSTIEARRAMCHREVELNRRLAPDVYLGVVDLVGPDGETCDHLVAMRRLPEDRRLATLVVDHAPTVPGHLRSLARLLAGFHAAAERSPVIDATATVPAVAGRWEDNTAELRPFGGTVVDLDQVERIDAKARRFLAGRSPLLDDRITRGRVCDGHGDLQAADVFCLDDGPRVLDCIEFNDALRYGDAVDDVGFLAMDLERLGAPELAIRFVHDYREFSADTAPASLVHHYIAYRAQVRAKVACLRAAQAGGTGLVPAPGEDGGGATAEARRLLDLCERHLDAGRVRLVLVGGRPGTGKSTLARGLARRLDVTVLRSDELRRELLGAPPSAPAAPAFEEGNYTPAATDVVYDELVRRAEHLLGLGVSCVLDASWTHDRHRRLARDVAARCHADLDELRCDAPDEVAAARIGHRRAHEHDVSEVTPEIAAMLAATGDPWPEAVVVPTDGSRTEAVATALALLQRSAVDGHAPHDERAAGGGA